MDTFEGYLSQIDRVLASAHSLFPADAAFAHGPLAEVAVPGAPETTSALGRQADAAGQRHRELTGQAASLHESVRQTVAAVAAVMGQLGAEAGALRDAARSEGAAWRELADDPAAVVQLVRAMDNRLAGMQRLIEQASEHADVAAAELANHSDSYTTLV